MVRNFIVFFILLCNSQIVTSNSNLEKYDPLSEKTPSYAINRYQKDFELSFKQGSIKIINHYGDVVIKNTTQSMVGVSAVVQEIGDDPAIHELDVQTKNNALMFEIKYVNSDLKKHKKSKSQFPIGRVDLVLFIPVEYQISVQTTIGKIDFKRVKNPIKAQSVSGTINASSYYDIQVESKSGAIKVFPVGVQWDKGIHLKSMSGTIYAIIPVKSNVKLDVKTKGTVKSQLDSIKEWTDIASNFNKSFGKKGKPYRIKSKSGAVYLSPHELVK